MLNFKYKCTYTLQCECCGKKITKTVNCSPGGYSEENVISLYPEWLIEDGSDANMAFIVFCPNCVEKLGDTVNSLWIDFGKHSDRAKKIFIDRLRKKANV